MGQVIVRIETVYGNRLIYPVNESASLFAQLTRKKTLTVEDINKIKAIGFEVVIQPEVLP